MTEPELPATVQVQYEGALRCTVTHTRSGQRFATDAPVDNRGRGEAISPTDSVASALLSCMLTTMAIAAALHELPEPALSGRAWKVMADKPRRIAALRVDIALANTEAYDVRARRLLAAAGRGCPVKLSLHPDIALDLRFDFEDAQ